MLEVLEILLLSNVHGHLTRSRSTCPTMLITQQCHLYIFQ